MSPRQAQRQASVPRDAASLRPVRLLWPLLVVLLGLAGWRLWDHLHDPHAYPIRKLTVDGEFRFLARESIQQLVGGAVSGGYAPDLRASQALLYDEAFKEIVVTGSRVQQGMPRFHELSDADLKAMQHYIRRQARKATAAAQLGQ